MEHLEGNRLPLIGDTAPAFQALTTKEPFTFQMIIRENGSSFSHIPLISPLYAPQSL